MRREAAYLALLAAAAIAIAEEPTPSALSSITLDECFRQAERQSETLAARGEDLVQALQARRLARANVLPHLTAIDTYDRQNEVSLGGATSSGFSFASEKNQLVLSLQQPIFSGFREKAYLAAAARSIEAARHGVEDSKRQLFAVVASAFYAVLRGEAQVATLADALSVERERLREMTARHEVGLARKTEVLLVTSQVASHEADLARSESDLGVARAELAFLLGQPAQGALRDAEPAGPPEGGLATLVRAAKQERRDLRALEAEVGAARHQVDFARRAYFPTVSLSGSYIVDRTNYSEFQEKTDWTAQLLASVPIFDGGAIAAGVATARSKLAQAELRAQELSRRIDVEVESAFLTLESDRAQQKNLEAAEAAASETSRAIHEEYRRGLAGSLELLTAGNQHLAARLSLERQRYQIKLDGIALSLAMGRIPLGAPDAGAAIEATKDEHSHAQ